MDSILSGIKDLIKYQVIQHINTGDKTLDSLINTFILAIMAYVFTMTFWEKIKDYYKYYFNKCSSSGIIRQEEYDYLLAKINTEWNKRNTLLATWYLKGEGQDKFTVKFKQFMFDNYAYHYPTVFDMNTKQILGSFNRIGESHFSIDSVHKIYKAQGKPYMPIYYICNDFICITIVDEAIVLAYQNKQLLEQFIDQVNNLMVKKEEEDQKRKKTFKISYANGAQNNLTIYPDRTFDKIVSKHKKDILNLIDIFVSINNENQSLFNGFGTYNIGFLLHGVPGTGKTSMIKAISNYLKRDVLIVDMSLIKTKKAFSKLFEEYDVTRTIYVLEEFDCVQGVIKARKEKEPETTIDLSSYKNQQMRLLQMMSTAKEESVINKLKEEVDDIKKNIDKVEDSLTLDTILTVLDGVAEVRNRVVIATTNHIEHIDPALLREGRFDFKINLGRFVNEEIIDILLLMYKDKLTDKQIINITKSKFREDRYTPVEIINICFRYRDIESVMEVLKE